MDAGLTIRPIANVAATDVARAAPLATADAVRTDLAPSKSVMALPAGSAVRSDMPNAGNQADTTREVIIDPAAREVIYRVIDVSSGRVVRQIPDEALLRLRAYTRALAQGETPARLLAQADIDA